MNGSFPSDSSSGLRSKNAGRGIEFQRLYIQEFVVEPQPSFTKSHLIPQQRAILVPNELLALRFGPFQSHGTLKVLVRSYLAVIC